MGHRDTTPIHVPLRTSSRNPSRNGSMASQENLGAVERKTSKAQRFFGTDITLPQEHTGWQEAQKTRQPSYIKPPSSAPRPKSGLVPFPSASETIPGPDHNLSLRVRASSPLLGHDYKSQEAAPPLPKPSKKIHHTGSSSTLFSYFSSKESKESKAAAKNKALQPRVRHGLGIDPQVTYQAPEPPKAAKRKMRPSRIDLSVLFPKPRNPAPQTLLSPQRMVSSPSSVSTAVTDYPCNKFDRTTTATSDSNSGRYVDPPPRRTSVAKKDPKHSVDNSDLPSIAETRNSGWFDQPLERTVGTSEIDVALDRYDGRRSLFSRSSVYTASREKLQPEQHYSQETRKSSRPPRTPSSQPKEMYLSPTSYPVSGRARGKSTSQESWKTSESKPKSQKSSVTKKSSRSTLKDKDLQNTSILCLSSSSEDEDEDEDHTPTTESKRKGGKFNSMGTYDESEPEIYTAVTAKAAFAKRFDSAPPTTSSHASRQIEQSQPPAPVPRSRKASQSSNGKSSTTRRITPNRSSGVPTIAEPDILSQFPQQPLLRSPAELKEMHRRSRYIAVTRQEQDLLEAMRVRKGKVTPSLFNAAGVDGQSVISGPSRDSFCDSDTSFLRLSNVFPPFDAQSERSTAAYKDGLASSGSDSEQKAGTALSSPGFSADYSESLPSSATSVASPLTPTLPIHRFSPLPSQRPPPRGPPPAIPTDQKQHTRRRTDSSEAIMLHESDEPKRNHGLPLWPFDFDWSQEHANIATVH